MNDYEQARLIELKTARLVQQGMLGAYRSAFRGSGLELDNSRPYAPGDDVRRMNWPVTARAQRPFIKQFAEERQLALLLLVDVSGSTAVGGMHHKREWMLELTAVLATAAQLNHDQVGLLLFSDQTEGLIRPGEGRNHMRRLIHTLLTCVPRNQKTDVGLALKTAVSILKQPGMVVLISDLLTPPENYKRPLTQLSQRHDVIAIQPVDPLERHIPSVGLLRLQDAETGQTRWVDSGDTSWQRQMVAQSVAHETAVCNTLRQAAVAHLRLNSSQPYLPKLVPFLAQHGQPRRGGR